jgi:hypothetical protein
VISVTISLLVDGHDVHEHRVEALGSQPVERHSAGGEHPPAGRRARRASKIIISMDMKTRVALFPFSLPTNLVYPCPFSRAWIDLIRT